MLAASALLALAASLASEPELPIRAARWLAPGADPVAALAYSPAECLAPSRGPLEVEVGRAAFRSPLLLGGQAARAGISCESCHRSGRGNPDFLFPGLSGAPGTADVTSFLFSTHRGDDRTDPKPIPDLGGPKAALKISQAAGDPALVAFIHGLVAEEFDGPEPAPAVLSGLAAYVRALDPAACRGRPPQRLTAAGLIDDADRAVAAAEGLLQRGDPAARALVVAARARLALADERFAAPDLAPHRAALRAADGRLAAAAAALQTGAPDAAAQLAAWRAEAPALARRLTAAEPGSLFNPRRLAAAAGQRLPREAP